MPAAKVRTTVTIPAELIAAVDAAVREGLTKSRNEFFAAAIRNQLARKRRQQIDAAFAGMADDPAFQSEAVELSEDFDGASWEAFRIAESGS